MSVSSGLDKHPHPKQRQHYGIDYLLASHPIMRRLRAAGSTQLHGNKNWGAAFLLMDYLQQHPLAPHSRVLDVGCGWGGMGLYLAQQTGAHVTGITLADNQVTYANERAAEEPPAPSPPAAGATPPPG